MIGAYQKGSDARVDFAMDKIDSVNTFLKQSTEEKMGFEETVKKLKELF